MPPRKEPKEIVKYPASKRKAPPFKPQRPLKAPKTTDDSIPSRGKATTATYPARKAGAAKKTVHAETPAKRGTSKLLKAAASRRAGISIANNILRESSDEEDTEEGVGKGDDSEVQATLVRKGVKTDKVAARELSSLPDSGEDSDEVLAPERPPSAKRKASKSAIELSDDEQPVTTTSKPSRGLAEISDLSSDSPNSPQPAQSPTVNAPPPLSQTDGPVIPQPLLIRLLHESFANKATRIDKQAIQVLQQYFEVFTREALARAAAGKAAGKRGGTVAEDWLEVEDLERVAPAMYTDF